MPLSGLDSREASDTCAQVSIGVASVLGHWVRAGLGGLQDLLAIACWLAMAPASLYAATDSAQLREKAKAAWRATQADVRAPVAASVARGLRAIAVNAGHDDASKVDAPWWLGHLTPEEWADGLVALVDDSASAELILDRALPEAHELQAQLQSASDASKACGMCWPCEPHCLTPGSLRGAAATRTEAETVEHVIALHHSLKCWQALVAKARGPLFSFKSHTLGFLDGSQTGADHGRRGRGASCTVRRW